MKSVAFIAMMLCGCSLRPVMRTSLWLPTVKLDADQCIAIDRAYIGWSATAIASGVLSGGGGLVAGVLPETTPREATGGVSLGLAVITAVSGFVAMQKARQYTAGCTTNVGGNVAQE